MSTASVVINFDIFKYPCFYLLFGMLPIEDVQFPFECFEKTFRAGIVPDVAFTTHALPHRRTNDG